MNEKCKDCANYAICVFWQEIINGLVAEYSDTRVDGIDDCLMFKDKSKIIELPCKVGDTVYTNNSMQGWYMRAKNRPYKAEIVFIGINNSEDMGYGFINVLLGEGRMLQYNFSDIGKRVFLTKEEAEKKLEELKGESPNIR